MAGECVTGRGAWTILIYIAAHNNLEVMGQGSLDQILAVGSSPEVRLPVFFNAPSGAARYIAGGPGTAAAEERLGAIDSGDPRVPLDAARWAFTLYPAKQYGLVLWSHGTGWRPEEIAVVARQMRPDQQVDRVESKERAAAPGSLALFRTTLAAMLGPDKPADRAILFDDGTGHSLDTLELERVAAGVQEITGQPLDLLGMDACLMATLEVAYQVRASVRYLVASEELVPGSSWPYDRIFGELLGEPTRSASALAVSVVRRYTEHYTNQPPAVGDVTKVALDLAGIGALTAAVDALAGALLADLDTQADVLWQAQLACYERESRGRTREPNKFRYHLWDVGSLATGLLQKGSAGVSAAARSVSAAVQPGGPLVMAEGHYGEWFDGTGGVSVYLLPPKRQRISPYYGATALASDTRWGQMLAAYHDHYT